MASKIKPLDIHNRKANFEYTILEKYSCGMMLAGSEVKSIRENGCSINEAYCMFKQDALFVRNMNIPIYEKATLLNHEPMAQRKLLLRKKEIEKIEAKVKERGLTIIPLRVFTNERGLLKMEIGLCKGKKTFDKRETLKQKDSKRELDRVMKKYKAR